MPVLLAERIQAEHRQAIYFGIWTFLGKNRLSMFRPEFASDVLPRK